MHVIFVQNIMAQNELRLLASPGNWFVSYMDSSPKLGCEHDSIIGMAEITKHGVTFDKYHAMSMFSSVNQFYRDINFTKESYLGRELVSMLLPRMNLSKRKPAMYMPQYAAFIKYHPEDISVEITRGELTSGILDVATIGAGRNGSLFHIINNEYGSQVAMNLIYEFQQLSSRYFLYAGFTAGLSDIDLSKETMKRIKQNAEEIFLEAGRITERLYKNELIAPLGLTVREHYENEQINALTAGDEFIIPVLSNMDLDKNNMLKLVLTGSKGNTTNLVQINAALGSQLVGGRRAAKNFSWERTSPYFQRYETDPKAHGYVPTSFKEGSRPDVFPFAAADGRFGIINIALSTSITGYINKLCVKNLESMITSNLRSCVKNRNTVQLLFAENGFDTRRLERVKFPTVMMSDIEFEQKYHSKLNQFHSAYHKSSNIQQLLDEEFETLKRDRQEYRSIFMHVEDICIGATLIGDDVLMPINIQRIIDDVGYNYGQSNAENILNPVETINKCKTIMEMLPYIYYNSIQEQLHRVVPSYVTNALTLTRILLQSYLCTAYLLKNKIGTTMLDAIAAKIRLVLLKALIDPGTSVGTIAAQCICSQQTQYMLDSRHRTGGGGSTRVDAVVRFKEIIGILDTDRMKNPTMLIRLPKEYEKNKMKAREIANHIEVMHLSKFLSTTMVFFEQYKKIIHPDFEHENKLIENYEKLNKGIQVPQDLAQWCIRFELDREKMIFNVMKLDTIIMALRYQFPWIYIVYTPEHSKNIIIRCYIRYTGIKTEINEAYVMGVMRNIKQMIVRGVPRIQSASVIDIAKSYIDEDGSIKTDKIYAIETYGTNLETILANEYIDPYLTQCDSIVEFEKIFGIAAARDKIIYELTKTLKLSKSMCTLLVDELCYSGIMTGVAKTGLLAREPNNISLRASVQSPVQIYEAAASDSIIEQVYGASGNLLVGGLPRIGSLYNKVVISERFLQQEQKEFSTMLEELL